jgi:hypothetical protein
LVGLSAASDVCLPISEGVVLTSNGMDLVGKSIWLVGLIPTNEGALLSVNKRCWLSREGLRYAARLIVLAAHKWWALGWEGLGCMTQLIVVAAHK